MTLGALPGEGGSLSAGSPLLGRSSLPLRREDSSVVAGEQCSVPGQDSLSAPGHCSCCGVEMMMPCFTDQHNHINQLISESFLTVKGAALFLPRGNSPSPNADPAVSQRRNKHTGDLQQHLQTMFTVLRPEDNIRLAVRLESVSAHWTRYMVVVSTNGRQDTEESIVLGVDFSSDSCCTVGLVLPLWSDTLIHLDGDGGFSVSTVNRVHIFKPVSVQAMWSALQSLHKACEVARCHNHYPGSLFLTWVSYYQSRLGSDQNRINEWNAMPDVQSHRADSPVLFTDMPTERERTERLINMRLREIMMQKDLENITSKEIRTELEMQMVCNLREFKEYIDNEMIVILGQMDSPTEIFEHVYLGSEWNASNLEELQNSGVRYILNVTREIDNFFPGMFEYHNIRVYDEETTNLLEYWNDTYKFISKAKKAGSKVLVHCKMGVSRSASTVIAYAMKEYGWDLDHAHAYVKERRSVTKPNPAFMKQLEEYQGILLASKQRHNKLWRSHSDSDLSDQPHGPSPSLHHFLGVAVLQALGGGDNGPMKRRRRKVQRLDNSCPLPVYSPTMAPPALPLPPPHPHAVRLSATVPDSKPVELFLDLPERNHPVSPPAAAPSLGSSGSLPPSLGSTDCGSTLPYTPECSLSDVPSDILSPVAMSVSPATPPPPVLTPDPKDDNNNPSDHHVLQTGAAMGGRGEADGSSTHSAEGEELPEEEDSIDFFSAREKFLGLALDGRGTRGAVLLSEQAQTRTSRVTSPCCEDPGERVRKEEEELDGTMTMMSATCVLDVQSSDDIIDRPRPGRAHHHDNGVSVRHIVTEIESISNPFSSHTPSPSSPFSLQAPPLVAPTEQSEEEEEDRETGEVVHRGGSLTPPSSPTAPSCDWPSGSVRRATRQLELRLRQQEMMDTMVTASHQRSPTARSPPCSPSAHCPPLCPQGSGLGLGGQGDMLGRSPPCSPTSPVHSPFARSPPCSPNSFCPPLLPQGNSLCLGGQGDRSSPPLRPQGNNRCSGHRLTQVAESISPSVSVVKTRGDGLKTPTADPQTPPDLLPVASSGSRDLPQSGDLDPHPEAEVCGARRSPLHTACQSLNNTLTSAADSLDRQTDGPVLCADRQTATGSLTHPSIMDPSTCCDPNVSGTIPCTVRTPSPLRDPQRPPEESGSSPSSIHTPPPLRDPQRRPNSSIIDPLFPSSPDSKVSRSTPSHGHNKVTNTQPSTVSPTETLVDAQPLPQPSGPIRSRLLETPPSDLLILEGLVTEEEEDGSDWPASCCDARLRLARGGRELEKIQRTLSELQAFLLHHQAPAGSTAELHHQAPACPTTELHHQAPAGPTAELHHQAPTGPTTELHHQAPGDPETTTELQAFLLQTDGLETTTGEENTAVGRLEANHMADRWVHGAERSRGSRETQIDQGLETELVQGSRDRCRQGRSLREWSRCPRLLDLESRIRQAGLTPPSLLKRSASLAKLDRLELCATELSHWDPQALRTPRVGDPQDPRPCDGCPDDSWKKQRVLGGAEETHNPTSTSYSSQRSVKQDEEDFNYVVVAMVTGRAQGSRGKPSTEKKPRTTDTVLYNTV